MRQGILSIGMICALAACGDPLRDVARLSDVNAQAATAAAAPTAAQAAPVRGGLFGRLLNRAPDDPINAAVSAALAEADVDITDSTEATVSEDADPAQVLALAVPEATTEPARERRGLAALFSRNPDRQAPRTGPDTQDIGAGAVLPFGEIARVCGLRNSQLGTRVDTGSGFDVYDTIPNSTAPRPFYITGFNDNCARTFTGAVVVTGDVETHEFVRYRPSNERLDYTTTDNAYEALKASVCRVGRGQPCGERLDRLDRNTHFITVYNFFGGTFSAVPTRWAQILVHDGEVLAMSIKDGQQ